MYRFTSVLGTRDGVMGVLLAARYLIAGLWLVADIVVVVGVL